MTGTDLARTAPSGTLALQGNQGDWTEQQRAALAQIGVAEAPLGDQMVLLHVAQRTGLDPFARQIYMIGRNDRESGGKKWTIQSATRSTPASSMPSGAAKTASGATCGSPRSHPWQRGSP
jgi:hypothetical protein